MRWRGREQSSNVEDRRGSSGGFGGFGRGLGGGGRDGKKTGVLGFIVLLIGAYYGVDLSGIVGTPSLGGGDDYGASSYSRSSSSLSAQQEQDLNEMSRVVLRDTEITWQQYFAQSGQRYTPATMVLYTGGTRTACGTGQSAMGPFYCPSDNRVYLDLSFYSDMKHKLKADGDTAFAYVIAHEVGHHVQNVLGILPQVHRLQKQNPSQANALSVKLELQADCFAGIWGNQAAKKGLFETGDLEEAFNAAEAVGDDRLQKRSQGYAIPDSFTHGTSAQRLAAFQRGLKSGDPSQCQF